MKLLYQVSNLNNDEVAITTESAVDMDALVKGLIEEGLQVSDIGICLVEDGDA